MNIYCKNKNNKTFLLLTYADEYQVAEFLETYCEALRDFKDSDPVYWITYPAIMQELELPVDNMGYIVWVENGKPR